MSSSLTKGSQELMNTLKRTKAAFCLIGPESARSQHDSSSRGSKGFLDPQLGLCIRCNTPTPPCACVGGRWGTSRLLTICICTATSLFLANIIESGGKRGADHQKLMQDDRKQEGRWEMWLGREVNE